MNKRGKVEIGIKEKKAISPVVSTVLLIVIVIMLAVIIFIWAQGLFKEKIEKFEGPIEDSCPSVDFVASQQAGKLSISNRGNVPIYIASVKKQKTGTEKVDDYIVNLDAGESTDPQDPVTLVDISGYEKITIIPVLLGKSGKKTQPYTCPEEYGFELNLS